jgi:non-ribosomal peptide synthetase component F
VLGVHGSSDDVLFGVVTSGRTGNCRGIENIAGSLMTTLPCRVRLPSGATYLDVMRSVHSQAAATSPYEFLGLNDIIRAGSFVGLQDIFNVLLTIENLPGLHETTHPLLGRNLRGHWLEMNYPLALTVFPSEDRSELRLHFQWDSRYLAHADVDWFKSHLLAVCTAIMADPEGVISERDLLSHEEEEYVREVGIGLSPAPELAARAFLHDAIDIAAAAHAAVNAVEYARGNSITYEALIRLTNQVAHGLQKHGIGPERTVPVLFDKNADQLEAVVAMLATMKAGGAFIPLDSAWPAGRLASCIRQTNSTFVLCDTNHPEVALEMKVPILTVAELADGQPATTPVTPDLRSESLAYIMFTSGSTGEPKGVMIEHRNMLAYVAK